jgi:dipeptidyl aminopeptidase/acylaminoacyl peptidase
MTQSDVEIDDILRLNVVSDAQIAPGGGRVLCSTSENGTDRGERNPRSAVWLYHLDGKPAVRITTGAGSDTESRFSPSGKQITFLSDRDQRNSAQLYLVDETPRDARKLTALPAGVSRHVWSPDGEHIALLSTDHVPELDNDVKLFDTDRRFRRLYLCNPDTGETHPLSHGDLHIWEYCWSPDSAKIAAIVSDEPFEWGWYQARLVTIDIESGDVSTVYEPERQIARPAWSPDGSAVAVVTSRWSDPGMTGGDVLLVDMTDGKVRPLTAGEPRSHYTVHWCESASCLFTFGLQGARAQVCRIDISSGSTPLWTADMALNDYGGSFDPRSGRIATTLSSPAAPPDVWVGSLDEQDATLEMTRLPSANPSFSIATPRVERLQWNSPDGLPIEGWYIAPDTTDDAVPPPMVTLVHGGPTAASMPGFPMSSAAAWTPLLRQSGIAVFMPNFRGSTGYGVEFAEANIGDLGGGDLQDILSGIDACVERGLADPERLGIGGWSYGGYITAWAITQTNRFAAAVAGASITNWYSYHGGTNIPGFDEQFVNALPDDLDSPYAWTSPLFFSKQVATPTLFVHGEQDECCPVGQAYEMTRALRRLGVPVECAVYPREPHGFKEREHRRDMVERSVGWFRRWLGAL